MKCVWKHLAQSKCSILSGLFTLTDMICIGFKWGLWEAQSGFPQEQNSSIANIEEKQEWINFYCSISGDHTKC